MAQGLACWAHNPKVPGSKAGSAMLVAACVVFRRICWLSVQIDGAFSSAPPGSDLATLDGEKSAWIAG